MSTKKLTSLFRECDKPLLRDISTELRKYGHVSLAEEAERLHDAVGIESIQEERVLANAFNFLKQHEISDELQEKIWEAVDIRYGTGTYQANEMSI